MSDADLHIDFETRSLLDLRAVGSYIYAMHPSTEPWCASYAFGEGAIKRWRKGQPCPPEVREHIEKGGRVVAHNAQFERVIFTYIMGPRFGWPVPKLEQWECTMARAYAMSLPGSLEEAAAAVGLPAQKDMAGRRLILQMAKPRSKTSCGPCKGAGKFGSSECIMCDGLGVQIVWWDDEERQQRGMAYCDQDVEVERQLDKRVMQLRPQEREVWLLDQRMNDRGVYIDKELCERALIVVDKTQDALSAEMKEVTKGEVASSANVSDLVKWLNSRLQPPWILDENGDPARPEPLVDSVAKDKIDEMLAGWDLPDDVRRALEIRQESAKTSTAKIKKMLSMRAPDGRMRGNLQYHGASTGRWAARGAQLQNLPRPKLKKQDIIDATEAILRGASPAYLNMMFGPPLSVVSDCIRGMVAAAPGNDIMAADFSAIEARVVAWLAGQTNVVRAFANGEDIYSQQASVIYQRPINRKLPEHTTEGLVGKVAVLALGFGGGAEAFAKMAINYGIRLEPIFDAVWGVASAELRQKASEGYQMRGRASKFSEKAWITAELIKLAWREANPAIVQFWYDLERAAINAVKNPGKQYQVGTITYKVSGSFLWCRLPSGRPLCYPYPRIKQVETAWGSMKEAVVFKAVNALTRKWEDSGLYGGLQCENVTQAVARDIAAEAELRLEKRGYMPVILIHDEGVHEVLKGFGNDNEFTELMTETPPWAAGCPITAEGWRAPRYRK